jgi:hypothetical protein
MNFKIINKNNVGIALVLLLAVLLSQTKFLNFMINTALGRGLFIVILLFVSYINKILGVVCVLLFIIMANNSDAIYLEGVTTMSNANKKQDVDNNIKSSIVHGVEPATTTPATTTPATTTPATTTPASMTPASTTPAPVSSPTTNIFGNTTNPAQQVAQAAQQAAQEGFDIIGKERTLQRGKNSNSIPVNDFMKDSDNVSPYESAPFSESFGSYY